MSCKPIVVITFQAVLGFMLIGAIFIGFLIYIAYVWIVDKIKSIKKYFKK